MKLYISAPSPYARKARIALLEKAIAHQVDVHNPWEAPLAANPLGKVPALVLDDGRVVHDSGVIVEYLETLGVPPPLIPAEPGLRFLHKQIEAIADGICDAVVLIVLERGRPPARRSDEWIARQAAKVPAALDALEAMLAADAFTAHGYGLAELATGCALGYLDLRYPECDWRAGRPRLARLFEHLSRRPAFAATVPAPQPVAIG